MMIRITTLLACLLFLTSCKDKVTKTYDPSVINHDKIDRIFGNDVSEVLFDHLYVVLDSISYAQLVQNSTWKDSYASIDGGLPDFEPIDGTTTSCYLRGHQHYIELLGPNNTYNEPVGKSGIGFSLRNRGEHFHLGVMPKLKEEKSPYLSKSEMVDMLLHNKKTTWFKAFYSPNTGTALHTWYAFYNPAFLDSMHQTGHQHYDREAFLEKSYSKERLFEEIRFINMTCTIKDYERIAHEMRQLGRKLIKQEAQALTIASGDVTITIKPSNTVAFSRITQIGCGLHTKDTSTTTLGNLTITNTGTQSLWNLENLYKTE